MVGTEEGVLGRPAREMLTGTGANVFYLSSMPPANGNEDGVSRVVEPPYTLNPFGRAVRLGSSSVADNCGGEGVCISKTAVLGRAFRRVSTECERFRGGCLGNEEVSTGLPGVCVTRKGLRRVVRLEPSPPGDGPSVWCVRYYPREETLNHQASRRVVRLAASPAADN